MPEPGAKSSSVSGTRFSDVRWFGELDSTNRYLLDQARAGAAEGLVAVADYQSAGRGRLGRSWSAPPGASLLVSVLLRPDLAPDRLHLVNAAMALSGADAAHRVAGVEPGLKWPNDLMVGPRKLAGVLAEADVQGGGAAVVVGMGMNVNWPDPLPDELQARAVSLDRLAGHSVDRGELLESLLRCLEARVAALGTAGGAADVASEYRRRCVTIGQVVRVELADGPVTGTAADVSDDGHLLVDVGMCLRTVSAGDVVHLRPAGPA